MQVNDRALTSIRNSWSRYLVPVALGLAGTASAHHSFANFDQSKSQSLQGTVKAFEFHFPHSWIWLNVTDAKGGTQVWGFEGAGPVELNRIGGWTASTLRPGDKISVKFCPLLGGKPGGAFTSVTLSNGKLLKGFELACVPKKPPQ